MKKHNGNSSAPEGERASCKESSPLYLVGQETREKKAENKRKRRNGRAKKEGAVAITRGEPAPFEC